LPFLRLDEPAGIPLEDFHALCRQWLKPKDYLLIMNTHLEDVHQRLPSCPVLRKWQNWEASLRNELVNIRAQRLGRDPFRYIVPSSFVFGMAELAQEVMGMANPLDAEETLNRARWDFLEELEMGHFFDEERLVLYSLKLQLLDRRARFDREKGREKFEYIHSKLKNQIQAGEDQHD
jgi:hypothetical protein